MKKLDGSTAQFNPLTFVSSVKPLLDAIAANEALRKVCFRPPCALVCSCCAWARRGGRGVVRLFFGSQLSGCRACMLYSMWRR